MLILSGDIHPHPGPIHPLSICHVNVRSLCPSNRAKRIDILHSELIIRDKHDIICVSETWLDDTISNESVDIPNYQCFRNDRNKEGGGVAIYVNDYLPVKRRKDLESDQLETVLIELFSQGKRFIIGC